MARTPGIAGISPYYLCLIPAIVALVCLVMSTSRFMAYVDPVHTEGAPDILSTSFEAWRASVQTGLSEPHRTTDSTGRPIAPTVAPNDSSLRAVFDVLQTQALGSHKHRLIMSALQPAIMSMICIVVCVGLWCWLRGTPVLLLWLLVVLVPVVYVGFGRWAFLAATNRTGQFFQEPAITVWQAIEAAAPFFVLALLVSRRRISSHGFHGITMAWILGTVLTAALYWLQYYEGYTYWRDEGTGGANIGLGLLMLASPLLTGAGMFLGYRIGMRHQKAAR
jgi:hypothetical protein